MDQMQRDEILFRFNRESVGVEYRNQTYAVTSFHLMHKGKFIKFTQKLKNSNEDAYTTPIEVALLARKYDLVMGVGRRPGSGRIIF